jgi:RNA polymerase sigma-70 factor, ECF subfamily
MSDDASVASLVAGALADNDQAARELVRHLYPFVVKLVRAHRPRRVAEEDLCQMIFIKIFQKLGQYSGAVPLEHWVSRIAVNTCLNQIAAEKARPEVRRADLSQEQEAVLDRVASSSDEIAPGQELAARDLVAHLLEALKPAERLVIDLMYLEQKSVQEIRTLTGWSAPLIKVRAFRARQKLKEQLAQLHRRENA